MYKYITNPCWTVTWRSIYYYYCMLFVQLAQPRIWHYFWMKEHFILWATKALQNTQIWLQTFIIASLFHKFSHRHSRLSPPTLSVFFHLFSTFSKSCCLFSLCSPFLFLPLVDYNRLTVVVSWRGAHSTFNLPGPRNPGPPSHLSPPSPAASHLRSSTSLEKVSLLLCLNP